MNTLLPLCTHSCLFHLQKQVNKTHRCLDSEIRWFLSAGMSSICWVQCAASCRRDASFCSRAPSLSHQTPPFPLIGVDNLFVAETLIDCLGGKLRRNAILIYRLVVAFPPVNSLLPSLLVKENNAVITGKGFLVSLSSCSNFCCSPAELSCKGKFCTSCGSVQTWGWHKPGTRAQQAGPRQGTSQGTCARCSALVCSSSSRGLVLPGMSWLRSGGWAGGVSSARCHHGHQITQCLSIWAKRYPHFPSTCTCRKGEA